MWEKEKMLVTSIFSFSRSVFKRLDIQCWLPAFSPFPAVFSKGLIFRVVKSCGCVVELSDELLEKSVKYSLLDTMDH